MKCRMQIIKPLYLLILYLHRLNKVKTVFTKSGL